MERNGGRVRSPQLQCARKWTQEECILGRAVLLPALADGSSLRGTQIPLLTFCLRPILAVRLSLSDLNNRAKLSVTVRVGKILSGQRVTAPRPQALGVLFLKEPEMGAGPWIASHNVMHLSGTLPGRPQPFPGPVSMPMLPGSFHFCPPPACTHCDLL